MTGRDEPPVGAALRAVLGTPRPVRRLSSSSRSRVWLVEFDGEPAIVKQSVEGADAAGRYACETTALDLAAAVRPRVVPAVLATDRAERVMVLEHLTGGGRATDWTLDYATALARLHSVGGDGVLPAWRGPGEADVRAFLGLAVRLEVAVPAGLEAELYGPGRPARRVRRAGAPARRPLPGQRRAHERRDPLRRPGGGRGRCRTGRAGLP